MSWYLVSVLTDQSDIRKLGLFPQSSECSWTSLFKILRYEIIFILRHPSNETSSVSSLSSLAHPPAVGACWSTSTEERVIYHIVGGSDEWVVDIDSFSRPLIPTSPASAHTNHRPHKILRTEKLFIENLQMFGHCQHQPPTWLVGPRKLEEKVNLDRAQKQVGWET